MDHLPNQDHQSLAVMSYPRQIVFAVVVGISLAADTAVGDDRFSEEECRQFAIRLSTAIEAEEVQTCSTLFNTTAFVDRLFEGLEFKYRDRSTVADEWLRSFKERHAVYASIVVAIRDAGSYRLVRVRGGGRKQLVMRLLSADGGLDYHVLTLRRNDASEPEVVDMYKMGAGGNVFSIVQTTLKRYTIFEGNDGKIVPEVPGAQDLVYQKRLLAGIQQNSKLGQHHKVLYFYSRLPRDVQLDKYVLLKAIQSAVEAELELGPPPNPELRPGFLVQRHLDAFSHKFPDDPALSVVTVGYYYLTQQFAKALACIEAIDKAVGGDPYLELLKARIHAADGNGAEAQRLAESALHQLPDLPQAYWETACICAGQRRFQRVVELLQELESQFEITVDATAIDAPEWKAFVESPAYSK